MQIGEQPPGTKSPESLADELVRIATRFEDAAKSSNPSLENQQVDLILPNRAGLILLEALDGEMLAETHSPEWDLRTSWKRIFEDQLRQVDELLSRENESEYPLLMYSPSSEERRARALEKRMRILRLKAHRKEVFALLCPPLTQDENLKKALRIAYCWFAFLQMRLIPSKTEDYDVDWPDVLPPLNVALLLGGHTATVGIPTNLGIGLPGVKASESRIRYRIQQSARIQAQACRHLAELLCQVPVGDDADDQSQPQLTKAATSDTNLKSEPVGSFEVRSEFVRVCGFSEDVSLEMTEGIERLIAIVTAQTRRMSVMELARIGSAQKATDRGSIDLDADELTERESVNNERFESALGDNASQAVRDEVVDLIARKKAAVERGDAAQAKALKQQIDVILNPLRSELSKAAKTVQNSLDRTYQRLRDDDKGNRLAAHFEKCVNRPRESPEYVYQPDESERKILWIAK